MENYDGLAHLGELIADRFGTDNAEKICYQNAMRVFLDVMK